MKQLLKLWLRKTGRTIQPINDYQEKLEPVKDAWLTKKNIKTIFDIGASNGGFAEKIRTTFPKAHIHSFEALPDVFTQLQNRFKADDQFSAHNIALNNYNGTTTFYHCAYSGSSSILEMDTLHKSAYPMTAKNEKIEVTCAKLDDYVESHNLPIEENVMLKIDVQGAEKLILEGATKLLERTQVIFSEVNFNSLYKENVLFYDLATFLNERGFKIEGLENVSQSLIDGTFLQADAYFVRKEK